MLIALLSAKGSPGVTVSALALASQWPRPAIAVDFDPQGGDMLVGVGGGREPARHGIVELIVEARNLGLLAAMGRQVIRPATHGPPVLPGFGAPGQAATVPWDQLSRELTDLPNTDVIADCGRLTLDHPVVAVLHACDLAVVVTGSSLRGIRATARALPLIGRELALPADAAAAGDSSLSLTMVVVAPGVPYPAHEIARCCGTDVAGTLPYDPPSAAVWSDGAHPGRAFPRSPLQHAARDLARALAKRAAACRAASVAPTATLNGSVRR